MYAVTCRFILVSNVLVVRHFQSTSTWADRSSVELPQISTTKNRLDRRNSAYTRFITLQYFVAYLPEQLVRDIGVADARIVVHDALLDQIGSELRLFSCNVNFSFWRIVDEILMNDDETASIDGETSKSNDIATHLVGTGIPSLILGHLLLGRVLMISY